MFGSVVLWRSYISVEVDIFKDSLENVNPSNRKNKVSPIGVLVQAAKKNGKVN